MDDDRRSELIDRAVKEAGDLRWISRLVELAGLAAIAVLIVFLMTDEVRWPAFTGLTFTVVVTVVLVARNARARSVALEVQAAQFEFNTGRQAPIEEADPERRPD